jgi:regulator of protease activity HflC (stomatin/prohibitin superfamily)
MSEETRPHNLEKSSKGLPGCFARAISLGRNYALPAILALAVFLVLFQVARAAVYKIRPWERGLHVRGGKFIAVDEPGWHVQIPFVDTVIGVVVSEQYGEIAQLAAMTSDEVTMDVSLVYTYRVTDPKKYRLEVVEPQEIIARFVQATLRDEVNLRSMAEVMHNREEFNQSLVQALVRKEPQYGIEFVTVQLQSASPPPEVVTAIKDRMVAAQKQEQAQTEASQVHTQADAEFYSAQRKAEAEAYQVRSLAEANAERIAVTSKAELEASTALLKALEGKGTLAEGYLQLLIAQALRENSKWVIGGSEGIVPQVQLPNTP